MARRLHPQMVMLRLPLLVLLACPAWGQFFDLATTDDGAVVYFATEHRRTGTDEPFQGRIYAVDAGGLRLIEGRELEYPEAPTVGMLSLTNFYDLSSPSVSGDGQVLAFAGRRDCSGSNRCGGSEVIVESTIAPGGIERALPGRLQLSANGRFALVFDPGSLAVRRRVVDLDTGAAQEWAILPSPQGGRTIADDGAVLMPSFRAIELLRYDGERTTIPLDEVLSGLGAMDAAARSAVFTSILRDEPGVVRLRWIDLASRELRTLAAADGTIRNLALTRDGKRVLFVSTLRLNDSKPFNAEQAFLVESDGSGLQRLPTGGVAVRSATISGDGRIVYLVNALGQLLKIDVESGETTELIPRTLDTTTPYFTGVYGSLGFLAGAGFSTEAIGASTLPLPNELGGFRMRFAGEAVPLLSVTPDLVTFQTPWTYAEDWKDQLVLPVAIEADGSGALFEPPPIAVRLIPQLPEDFKLPSDLAGPRDLLQPGLSLVAHQGYGSLVAPEDPAHPGEIVHAYLTGLGPVFNQPQTGAPAPAAEPLSRLRHRLICEQPWDNLGPLPAPVHYAGLAPGLVGVYQISLGVPPDAARGADEDGRIAIICRSRTTVLGFAVYLTVRR